MTDDARALARGGGIAAAFQLHVLRRLRRRRRKEESEKGSHFYFMFLVER
jgi:hypothetical protein